MRVAVEGCAHGELEKIYDTIAYIESKEGYKVDLLLCCGDFQSTRNQNDLECMAVPKKYQDICTFYKYYNGEKVAPVLTIFIGGNHEASNYLQELPYGGWVAPNIYYLGYAGVVTFRGIRIGGLSGIFKGFDYRRGRFESVPYDNSTIRSVYHYREQELFRLSQLTGTVDIMMSHDWPTEVYNYGNASQLIRFKPHFRDEIYDNRLGSPPCFELLKKLKPTYWFSGHLHCKFSAIIPHGDNEQSTKFLALDKCLPRRRFLQILEIETNDDDSDSNRNDLHYDLEWLTILYTTRHLTHVKSHPINMPSAQDTTRRFDFRPTTEELDAMRQQMANDLVIPKNFVRTAPPYDPDVQQRQFQQSFYVDVTQVKPTQNPQTVAFCDRLNIDDPLNLVMLMSNRTLDQSDYIDNLDATMTTTDASLALDESVGDDSTLNSTGSLAGATTLMKTRLSLFETLPPPKNNTEEVALDMSDEEVPKEIAEEKLDSPADPAVVTCGDEVTDEAIADDEKKITSATPVKQFKRRNASIYNAETDD